MSGCGIPMFGFVSATALVVVGLWLALDLLGDGMCRDRQIQAVVSPDRR